MKVTRSETGFSIDVNSPVPAVVVIFEAEARPVVVMSDDYPAVRRVALGLSREWQELLLELLEGEFVTPALDEAADST